MPENLFCFSRTPSPRQHRYAILFFTTQNAYAPLFPKSSPCCSAKLHAAVDVALRVPLGNILALIVILLAARQSDLHLRQPVLVYVHLEWHDRQALERCLPDELADLLLVQQQLAVAQRVGVKAIRPARTD